MTLAAAPSGNVPPQNLEAEESVLGAMMISPGAIDAVSDSLLEDHFYRQSHGRIYRAALALHDAGEPVDAITLTNALQQQGELDTVGGRTRLHELARIVPSTANASHYADIVRETATLRGLIRAGGEIAQLGWDHEGEPEELVSQAEQLVGDLAGHDKTGFEPIKDGLKDTCQQLVEAGKNSGGIIGVPTGLRSLDNLTAGLQQGNLIVLASRPSVGKSALALKIGWHACRNSDGAVGIVSLEMSRAEIVQRLLAVLGHVDLHRLRTGQLGHEETMRVFHPTVTTDLEKAPLYVDDNGSTIAEIKSRLRKLKRKRGLSLAVVDYLQLVAPPGSRNHSRTRNDEVAEVTRSLKLLAVELQVPVLALSQLNRKLEDRAEKRPQLSDLRDSGAIEQDANLVLLMHRIDEQTTEVAVAKNRNGPTGDIKLAFVKKEATFTEQAHLPGVVG